MFTTLTRTAARQFIRAAKTPRHRVVLSVEKLEGREVPTTWNVTNLAGDSSTVGSLPWCVSASNAWPFGTSDIVFDPNLNGTISLTGPMQTLSKATAVTGPANGAVTVTRAAGAGNFRIFTVATGASTTISGLTIDGGSADFGGGVYNSGNLSLNFCVISNNQASQTGGGIYNALGATLTLDHTTVKDNTSTGSGGGIYNYGTLTSNSLNEINHNLAAGNIADGGGIYNAGKADIKYSMTIIDNTARRNGGGVANGDGATFTMTSATLKTNSAIGDGGGIYSAGTTTITSCLLDHNLAQRGGGFFVLAGTASFTDTTFTGNNANSGVGKGGAWMAGSSVTRTNCGGQPDADFQQVP